MLANIRSDTHLNRARKLSPARGHVVELVELQVSLGLLEVEKFYLHHVVLSRLRATNMLALYKASHLC